MLCCIDCFHDNELKYFISKHEELKIETCHYCRSEDSLCLSPELLCDKFEFLISHFKKSDRHRGELLANLLQDHFYIFNKAIPNIDGLLGSILGRKQEEVYYELYDDVTAYTKEWDVFKNEIKCTNRFFPQSSIYSSLFKKSDFTASFFDMLEQLSKNITSTTLFYRARVSDGVIKRDDMGAPPPTLASGGRANPVGIPYLYLANSADTCIAEIRPNNASTIYLSKFRLKNPLKTLHILDLTEPRKKISVLKLEGDKERLDFILSYLQLLEALSLELSVPISPYSSHIDYLPTQLLCEFIKTVGEFDGISFNSSFGGGVNYVFYNPDEFEIDNPISYKVEKITYKYSVK